MHPCRPDVMRTTIGVIGISPIRYHPVLDHSSLDPSRAIPETYLQSLLVPAPHGLGHSFPGPVCEHPSNSSAISVYRIWLRLLSAYHRRARMFEHAREQAC